jgi:hypothetical protein
MNVPGSLIATDMDMADMHMVGMGVTQDMHMEAMDHSCCPDGHDEAPYDGDCDALSWLACGFHCAMAAPVFAAAAEIKFRHPFLGADRTPTHLSSLISVGDSPPFHPPKLFIRV